MTFPIGCSVSFCLKTLPLNTSLFEETVFEKSRVFNLSRFKISICIWWWFRVRVRTFEITEWVFVRFFWNQLWLSFGVNTEINILRLVESRLKVFCEIRVPEKQVCGTCIHQINLCSGSFPKKKVNMLRRDFLLLQDEHIIVFCVFTFRVDWNVFFVENEKYLRLREDEQFVGYSR